MWPVPKVLLLFLLTIGLQSDAQGESGSRVNSSASISKVAALLRQRIETEHWTTSQVGQSCGVYAACRALSLMGVSTDPGAYFTVQYISRADGSSPREVESIIEKNGVQAISMVNLSKLDLMVLPCPVIANVKQSANAQTFNHWVCVTYQSGRLLVFDGPGEAVEMSFAEFLPLWNGYGVMVTRSGKLMIMWTWLVHVSVVLWMVVTGILLWRIWPKQPLTRVRSWGYLGTLTVTLAMGGSFFLGNPFSGPLSGESSVETSEVNLGTFRQCVAEGSRLVIDARFRASYQRGAVSGSINVPVDISHVSLTGLFREVDRDLPIVIYCLSSQCEYDTILADKLHALGFRQIVVSEAGWREFSQDSKTGKADP